LKLFRNAGGRKVAPTDLQRTIAALPSPPEILLDGLFGYLHSYDDLWDEEEKQSCIEQIIWANSTRARCISIDKPAVAKTTAELGGELILQAEWLVEVGAVKEDVVSMVLGASARKDQRVFIVDLGFGRGIWKGVGVGVGRKRMGDLGVAWEGKWVVEVELCPN
jgi:enhancer of mRNA-decapping protein 3